MSNYNQVTVPGTVWTRCYEIVIRNPYLGLEKSATFSEENVVTIDNRIISNTKRFLHKQFNPTEVINLRDPATGTLTGSTLTHEELYTILYSLYLQTSIEKDQASA